MNFTKTNSSLAKPKKQRRKIGLWLIFSLLFFYFLYLIIIALSFPSPIKNPGSFKGESIGVYHLHTRFSDGSGTLDDLVKAAKSNHLDFIILTDHGRPNFACLQSQGWREGVLVLAGSELSTSRGHLVGLDISETKTLFPQKAEEAARMIQKEGGFSIIAHPYSKVAWSWGKENELYLGLELIDADTMLKKNWLSTLPLAPLLLFNPRVVVLKMIDPFPLPFRQWDSLNQKAPPVYGFFSCDAHLFYDLLLSLFRLRIPLDQGLPSEFSAARQFVFEALRSGAFYNSIDAAQPASGFKFWAERGGQIYSMGSLIPFEEKESTYLRIKIPSLSSTLTSLIHNGKHIFLSSEKEVIYKASEPGVFRVEVYLQGRSAIPAGIPWIVSNPIFLRMEKP